MAEAPPSGGGGSPLKAITRKVGPLPLWAYAVIVVAGYYLYRRSHPSSSTPAAATATANPVPGFDAAPPNGGLGNGSLGSTVNNYYYGDQAGQQAAGGGTSPGGAGAPPAGTSAPGGQGGSDPGPISGQGISYPGLSPTAPYVPQSSYVRPPAGTEVAL